MSQTWCLVERGFDVRYNRHYESLLALGSGPLQQRAALEEGLADEPQDREYLWQACADVLPPARRSCVGTYLAGITGPHPLLGDERINLPAVHGLQLFAGQERLDLEHCRVDAYERRLDLRTGLLARSFTWLTQRGTAIGVLFERFVSAARPHVTAVRCQVRHLAGPSVELRIVGTLDADVRTNGFDHFTRIAFTGEQQPITVEVQTNGGDQVAAAALLTAEPGIVWNVETEPRWAAVGGVCLLDPGASVTLCKYAAVTSSRHAPGSALDAARNLLWGATVAGFTRLAEESARVWQQRWEHCDVTIEGDPASQLAIRASLYHLLRAAVETDARVGLDMQLGTSEAGRGLCGWTADIFALPFFLYTRPDIALTLAAYRLDALPAARRHAQQGGYPGARYPWQAGPAGDEQCRAPLYADHGVHVTADVAYGLWHTALVHAADAALLARVTEALTETARFWAARVYETAGAYEILLAMGPDAYTPFSRNNAYTNFQVAQMLRCARQAWSALQKVDAAAADRLWQRLGLTEAEFAHLADVAARLRVPVDRERRLLLQSDEFETLEPFELARYRSDGVRPLVRVVPRERLHRSRVLEQADVLLLMALWPHAFDREHLRAAWEAYEPLTAHDAPVSLCTHAQIAAWLGRTDEALAYWERSIQGELAPSAAEDGLDAAVAGARWQAVVFGFAGLRSRMQAEVLRLDPHLPARWTALRFPFVWQGQPLRITVEARRVVLDHDGTQAVDALVAGHTVRLAPGTRSTVQL